MCLEGILDGTGTYGICEASIEIMIFERVIDSLWIIREIATRCWIIFFKLHWIQLPRDICQGVLWKYDSGAANRHGKLPAAGTDLRDSVSRDYVQSQAFR